VRGSPTDPNGNHPPPESVFSQLRFVNHFIPFTEEEVHAPDRFESNFMVQYMSGKTFSKEAKDVLQTGKSLWQAYFANTDVHTVRDELKLNRPDVGRYQIRKALQARNKSGDFPLTSFTPFEEAYKSLTEKLQPMVYELGFLSSVSRNWLPERQN
jgi:hypothetical protein